MSGSQLHRFPGQTLTRALARTPGKVGAVGWGSGGGFGASALSSASVPIDLNRILYFGDIDLRGLKIPASASMNALAVGLPAVEPADSLYQALLHRGQRQPHTRVSRTVAQEDVGLEYLVSTTEWRSSLT